METREVVAKAEIVAENRVAEISEWKNNCAVSCTAIFLINAFISIPSKLSQEAELKLTLIFNQYYQLSLSVEQLRELFLDKFTLPSDRQVILGPVLRDFLNTVMPGAAEEAAAETKDAGMLSNEAFTHLAAEFGFNVVFYALLDQDKIQRSGVIPAIIIDEHIDLTLRPYFNVHAKVGHYDLIMDDEVSARRHNDSNFDVSSYKLSIEQGQEEACRAKIAKLCQQHFAGQTLLDSQINKLFQLAQSIAESDSEQAAQIVLVASKLKSLCEDFFKKPAMERAARSKRFKEEFVAIVRKAAPAIGLGEWAWSWITFKSTANQLLQAILREMAKTINAMGADLKIGLDDDVGNEPPSPGFG